MKNQHKVLLSCGAILLAIYIFYFGYGLGIFLNEPAESSQELRAHWGEFGDGFGTLNTLFSLVAVIGVLTSLYMDRQSRIETSTQEHFFQMTQFLQKIVSDLTYIETNPLGIIPPKTHYGLSALGACFQNSILSEYPSQSNDLKLDIILIIHDTTQNTSTYSGSNAQKDVLAFVEKFHKENEYMLGNYFRLLYRILKYIDNSDIPESSKQNYAKILRAMLSKYELVVLFYNSIKFTKFKKYIYKYSLFDNLDLEMFEKHRALLLHEFSDQLCLNSASVSEDTYQAFGLGLDGQAARVKELIAKVVANNPQDPSLPSSPNQV